MAVSLLLGLSWLACGCRSSGWARLEPQTAWLDNELVVFEPVSAWTTGRLERGRPVPPMVIIGSAEQRNRRDEPVRTWWLVAFVEHAPGSGRVRVAALVARAERGGRPIWHFYSGRNDVETWQYADRLMIHGLILPSTPDESAGPRQRLSACLLPGYSPAGFNKSAAEMLQRLEQLQAATAGERGLFGEDLALSETIVRLRKLVPKRVEAKKPPPAKPAPRKPPPARTDKPRRP